MNPRLRRRAYNANRLRGTFSVQSSTLLSGDWFCEKISALYRRSGGGVGYSSGRLMA
jgi:hypothetical protein